MGLICTAGGAALWQQTSGPGGHKHNRSAQCAAVAMKAIKMLGYINKGISSRDRELVIPLYSVLVRTHVEYCIEFWSLLYKKDVDRVEWVWRRRGEKSRTEERRKKVRSFPLFFSCKSSFFNSEAGRSSHD